MGESKRRQFARYGERAALIDGEIRIVRFAHSPAHALRGDPAKRRVEFYLDRFTMAEAYAAVCAVKKAFEDAFARAAAQAAPPLPPAGEGRNECDALSDEAPHA